MDQVQMKKNMKFLFLGQLAIGLSFLGVFGAIKDLLLLSLLGLFAIPGFVLTLLSALKLRKENEILKEGFWPIIASSGSLTLAAIFRPIPDLAGVLFSTALILLGIITSLFAVDYMFKGLRAINKLEDKYGKGLYITFALTMVVFFVLSFLLAFDFVRNEPNLNISLAIFTSLIGMIGQAMFVLFINRNMRIYDGKLVITVKKEDTTNTENK